LATILHLRLSLPDHALAPMFASNRSTIRRVISETQQLLQQHGTTIEPITPSTPLTDFLTTAKIKPAS
jgi:L-lactate utilization protein LutB